MDETDHLLIVLGEQNADGSFKLAQTVVVYCGEELMRLVTKAASLEGEARGRVQNLLATLWVLKTFITKASDSKDLWRAAAGKAMEWLEREDDAGGWSLGNDLTGDMMDCWDYIKKELGGS